MSKNRIFFIFIGIIIIISVILIFNYVQNKPVKPPRISLSEEEWDFGLVKPNDKPIHIFTIKNEGDEDLTIERVRSSCGCVKTSISTKRIRPGKSAELKVTFDTTGYDGKVQKDIYIKSNDPQAQGSEKKIGLYIEIEHQSKPLLSVSENEWNLGLISKGDKPNLNLIIENKGDEDLVIDEIDTYEHISYNIILPLSISPEEKYEVTLTYDSAEHELGEVREAIRILSNDPKRAALPLRIKGYIKEKDKPTISIWPAGLDFNLKNDSEEGAIGKFTLENLGEQSAKIISIKSSVDYLVPLRSEIILDSGEKEDLQIVLLKNKIIKEIKEEEVDEYLYITIALPIKINK